MNDSDVVKEISRMQAKGDLHDILVTIVGIACSLTVILCIAAFYNPTVGFIWNLFCIGGMIVCAGTLGILFIPTKSACKIAIFGLAHQLQNKTLREEYLRLYRPCASELDD